MSTRPVNIRFKQNILHGTHIYYASSNVTAIPRHYLGLFWIKTPPLIKRSVCISRSRDEGLGMPHLLSRLMAIRLQTIRRLFDKKNQAARKDLARQQLSHLSGQYNLGYAVFAASGWMPDHRNYTKLSSLYRQLYMSWRNLTEDGILPLPSIMKMLPKNLCGETTL